ncbi:hypothetical protein PLESTB_001437200 [Pleodorina starrii]|uniref:Translation initiation factor IF-2, chloroplastic n=1 Tax=Pleodorina starrii TaxID=330485 RepID=A0A9W6BVL7_9CHLO|nr:hypothetical protein PLESTM_002011300 [Pleodorina starrii]GLC59042.1 hypothetical protein PLESTB_001437200 [Pleodorina starrii]GLC77111.1 hypothetical protein PLESTF_001885800 [Pleodorina starrii]
MAAYTSLHSASGCPSFQPLKAPLASRYCSLKWRSGIVAAAGPGPAGPQPLTKPTNAAPPRPIAPPSKPPSPFPAQQRQQPASSGNGNGNGYSNGAPRPGGPPRPGPPPSMAPGSAKPPAAVPLSAPPGLAGPGQMTRPGPPPSGPPALPLQGPPGAAAPRPGSGPAPLQNGAGASSAPPSAAGRPQGPPPPRPPMPPPSRPQQPFAASNTPRPSAPTAPPPPPVANPFANISRPTPPPAPTQPVSNPFANISRPAQPATAAPPPPASAGLAPPPLQRPPTQPPQPAAPPALTRPAPRPASAPPRPMGPPAARGGAGATAPPRPPGFMPPPSRPDLLPRQPPATAPTTAAAAGPASMELQRPDPPSLRVLEPLMGPGATAAARRLEIQEVVEEEAPAELFDEEDMEFVNKGAALKGKGKKGAGKRKEKVTAEMKRAARQQREAVRMEKEAARRKDKEEIFEVGDEGMSLDELAALLQVAESDIVRSLFMRGITLSMSQMLDKNTVKLVASDFDVVVVDKDPVAVTDAAKKRTEFISEEDIEDLAPRPPVVTVMGHVDHGKTSLLDYIRKARVAAGEAGGITQAIGAYNTEVEVDGSLKTICFLDTPGHEAFSAMRARGAQVTDLAIIIVAADDGVRPQTREAVAHAQAAGVPIVVAINKVDKPGADVERVKQELLELSLVPEEWGGSTPMVPVSAKKGSGVPDLLTQLLWVAEEKQLMSNPKRPAAGTVIEAYLDKKKGPVATLLVQVGTLRPGDIVRAGASYGKVRALSNDLGQNMPSAGPSIAVQLTGLNSVPAAGEEFEVCPSEQAAREAAAEFEDKLKLRRMIEMSGGGSMVTLSSLATVDEDQEAMQRLNLIIKADTSGMVEAIRNALSMLPQQSVVLRFLLAGAGEITASDVDLAAASGGLVLAFNLEPDEAVSSQAKRQGVSVKSYRIIYELIEDVKAAMEGKLKLVEERVPQGTAVVKAVFGTGKKKVAGCAVTDGKLAKAGYVTVKRGKTVVYEGKLSSLRRVKDIVEEVSAGLECGVACEGFTEWAEGDVLECYLLVTKSRRLEEARATTAVDVASLQ